MSYAFETTDGGVATANKPPRGVTNYIEVTEVPDAPRDAWCIVDNVLTFDATAAGEVKQNLLNNESRSYLLETDWYITRLSETGKAIPEDVKLKRQAAREAIK